MKPKQFHWYPLTFRAKKANRQPFLSCQLYCEGIAQMKQNWFSFRMSRGEADRTQIRNSQTGHDGSVIQLKFMPTLGIEHCRTKSISRASKPWQKTSGIIIGVNVIFSQFMNFILNVIFLPQHTTETEASNEISLKLRKYCLAHWYCGN